MPDCLRSSASYKRGCRCGHCRRAYAKAAKLIRVHRRKLRVKINGVLVAPVPEDRHGYNATYVNWSCRCELCKEAARVAAKSRGGRAPVIQDENDRVPRVMFNGRAIALVPADQHGLYVTYRKLKCRCERCVEISHVYRTGWRSAR